MIRYEHGLGSLSPADLTGFFEGWPRPPSREQHLALLRGSDQVVLAFDDDRVVGFVTAITDGVLAAYIPLLEVLPSHRSRGIGTELVRRVLDALGPLYMVDVVCDEEVLPFYEALGFMAGRSAMLRRRP